MATLRIFHQGVQRGEEELDADGTVVGRGDDVELRLDEAKLSRRHASIIPNGRQWVLEDLASKNGTFVNGRKEIRKELVDGDRIELGAWVLQFRRPEGEPVPVPLSQRLATPAAANPQGPLNWGNVVPKEGGATEYRPGRRDAKATETVEPRVLAKERLESRTLLGPRLVQKPGDVIHVLSKERSLVGAGAKCDVVIAAIGHAEAAEFVRREDGTVEVYKTGWLSRVKVNGETVSARLLVPGDLVRLGHAEFLYDNPLA